MSDITQIRGVQIRDSAVTTSLLANLSVTDAKIAATAVTVGKLKNSSVTTAKLVDGAVTNVKITNSSVTAAKLADNAVTTAKILDSNVTAEKLANNSVTSSKILDSNVTTEKIANGAVTTAKITDSAVTSDKMADSSTTTRKLANTAVTTAKIEDVAVTTLKLANSSVTTAKIANVSVTAAKIANGTITGAKIADSTITSAELADSSVITRKLANSNVTDVKIANSAVTTVKLANNAITTIKIADSSVTTSKLIQGGGGIGGIDSYASLVLHCDGTDGSTSFVNAVDSAVYTSTGSAQISTTGPKFGTGSASLNGTTPGLLVTNASGFDLAGGDFTLETWVKFNSSSTYMYFFSNAAFSGTTGFGFRMNNGNGFRLDLPTATPTVTGFTPTAGVWYHVACVRSGTDIMFFANGVQVGATQSYSGSIATPVSDLYIGATPGGGATWSLDGRLDEIRISKGIARWTSNFTPPASEYTSGSGATAAVSTPKILDSNVTTAKLVNNAVTTAKILSSNVTTAKLASSSVITKKLANSSVTTVKITDSNVTTTKLANNSVTSAKLNTSAVTTQKLANSNVTTAKIANSNVTTAKLANGAVGSAKFEATTITLQGLRVTGNAIFQGTTYFVQATNIAVRDNMVTVGSGATGASAVSPESGLEVDRGSGTDAKIFFNETTNKWYVDKGQGGGSEELTTGTGLGTMITNEAVTRAAGTTITSFQLAFSPMASTEKIYHNGERLRSGSGNDYTVSGNTITLLSLSLIGGQDTIIADYRYTSGGAVAPVITSALTASGTQNVTFSYQITASNTPTSFNATGLPTGLSVNTGTGLIDGTPTVGGTFSVTISATNAGGTGSDTLVITLDLAPVEQLMLDINGDEAGASAAPETPDSNTNLSLDIAGDEAI